MMASQDLLRGLHFDSQHQKQSLSIPVSNEEIEDNVSLVSSQNHISSRAFYGGEPASAYDLRL
jgi:hypothetical protein